MSAKIFMTTIGKGNSDAAIRSRRDFEYELKTNILPMRWSGKQNKRIDCSPKYMGFMYYNSNGDRMLAAYNIIEILPPGVGQRGTWIDDYKTAETILLGDLVGVMEWSVYTLNSRSEENEPYDANKSPQGNTVMNINTDLLKKLPDDLDKKYKFSNANFVKNKNTVVRTATENRYEIIVKNMLRYEFPEFRFKHNASIRVGNNRIRRPDFYYEFEGFTLIIEYDEHNHVDRNNDDEMLRMNQLRDYFAPDKVVIIRYGNASQSWIDARSFIECIDNLTVYDEKVTAPEKNKIILIGYPQNPYQMQVAEWDVEVIS